MALELNGTTGVDKVQAGAIEATDIPDASLPIAKLSTTGTASSSTYLRGDGTWQTISASPTTAQVLSATAGASVGAVGTYCKAYLLSNGVNPGGTTAGSSLRGVNSSGQSYNPGFTGTWRNMGASTSSAVQYTGTDPAWLRIS